ncbi:MAG TPA: hypothetical protein VK211_28815 [Kamptonema sp.]|nr:hypothetical protein [Kamptonema sp.]
MFFRFSAEEKLCCCVSGLRALKRNNIQNKVVISCYSLAYTKVRKFALPIALSFKLVFVGAIARIDGGRHGDAIPTPVA